MERASVTTALKVAAFGAVLAAMPALAQAKQTEPMRGAAALTSAIFMARSCDGIGLIGGQSEDAFLQSGSKTLKKQGFRRQAVLKHVYYTKTEVLMQATEAFLSGVGASLNNKTTLCRRARQVVGTSDLVGQFLEKK